MRCATLFRPTQFCLRGQRVRHSKRGQTVDVSLLAVLNVLLLSCVFSVTDAEDEDEPSTTVANADAVKFGGGHTGTELNRARAKT